MKKVQVKIQVFYFIVEENDIIHIYQKEKEVNLIQIVYKNNFIYRIWGEVNIVIVVLILKNVNHKGVL